MSVIQDFLPGFLEADTEAREAIISKEENQLYLARQFCRYDKALRVCKNESMKTLLEKAKRDIIKLMEKE